jgi:hypothetical protein
MKAYISGPITGMPDYNFIAFNRAETKLKNQGYEVFNPVKIDNGSTDRPWEFYMRLCLKELPDCNVLFVLPGWEKSKGASFEVQIAKALKIPIINIETDKEIQEDSVLKEAESLINGPRQVSYDHPLHNFSRTALFIQGILLNKLKENEIISPEEVGLIMIAMKISRKCNKHSRDNLVDLAGYAGCIELIKRKKDEINRISRSNIKKED